jgi:hypothetical protein
LHAGLLCENAVEESATNFQMIVRLISLLKGVEDRDHGLVGAFSSEVSWIYGGFFERTCCSKSTGVLEALLKIVLNTTFLATAFIKLLSSSHPVNLSRAFCLAPESVVKTYESMIYFQRCLKAEHWQSRN